MRNANLLMMGCLLSYTAAAAQEQPRVLKGGAHVLGETAEQFYSEGYVGELLRACQAGDWKSVNHIYNSPDHSSKSAAKDICAKQMLAKGRAASGERVEYQGGGDPETLRADKFLLDGGRLVKIAMVYNASVANFEGSHAKSYAELLAGLQEAYGAPTKSYTEEVVNTYGVKYDARRAGWMGKQDVISVTEQPGANGWTEIVAETIAEFNRAARAPKSANPLQ